MHVHIVGNGSSGSGCWLKSSGLHRLYASYMLHHIGLPQSALSGDLDTIYVERLLELVRSSSLEAIVILAHEQVYNDNGTLMQGVGSLYVPNNYVLNLAKLYPEFIPAVSIHPARPDAMDELEHCLENGAQLMKCLPNCQNINISDKRFTAFWERMAKAGLPLLAHTGGEHTVQIIKPEYSNPRLLELPLQCGVTVIAAHCGTKGAPFDIDYFDEWAQMTKEYPNLYGDNSAFNSPFRSAYNRKCIEDQLLTNRILNGSDYPVPVIGWWALLHKLIDWKTFRKWAKHPNVLERDYQLKIAMGYSDDTFTRFGQLLRNPLPHPATKQLR